MGGKRETSLPLPALTGRPPPSDLECALFTLPARLGGLGIRIPSETAASELQSSLLVTSSLKDHILDQDREYGHNIIADQLQNRATINRLNRERSIRDADDLYSQLSDSLQRAVNLAKGKGASTWLTVLPLTDHGFALHKSAFHDALALRYGWTPSKLPSKCDSGNSFTVEHALSCARGGLPTIRHNEIRDLTANLLTEVCNDVRIEPELQAVTMEHLTGGPPPTHRMEQGLISLLMVCGVGDLRRPTSTCEFSTPTHPRTSTWHPQPVTRNMSGRRNGHTNSVFVKSNTPPSPHLSWQRQEV